MPKCAVKSCKNNTLTKRKQHGISYFRQQSALLHQVIPSLKEKIKLHETISTEVDDLHVYRMSLFCKTCYQRKKCLSKFGAVPQVDKEMVMKDSFMDILTDIAKINNPTCQSDCPFICPKIDLKALGLDKENDDDEEHYDPDTENEYIPSSQGKGDETKNIIKTLKGIIDKMPSQEAIAGCPYVCKKIYQKSLTLNPYTGLEIKQEDICPRCKDPPEVFECPKNFGPPTVCKLPDEKSRGPPIVCNPPISQVPFDTAIVPKPCAEVPLPDIEPKLKPSKPICSCLKNLCTPSCRKKPLGASKSLPNPKFIKCNTFEPEKKLPLTTCKPQLKTCTGGEMPCILVDADECSKPCEMPPLYPKSTTRPRTEGLEFPTPQHHTVNRIESKSLHYIEFGTQKELESIHQVNSNSNPEIYYKEIQGLRNPERTMSSFIRLEILNEDKYTLEKEVQFSDVFDKTFYELETKLPEVTPILKDLISTQTAIGYKDLKSTRELEPETSFVFKSEPDISKLSSIKRMQSIEVPPLLICHSKSSLKTEKSCLKPIPWSATNVPCDDTCKAKIQTCDDICGSRMPTCDEICSKRRKCDPRCTKVKPQKVEPVVKEPQEIIEQNEVTESKDSVCGPRCKAPCLVRCPPPPPPPPPKPEKKPPQKKKPKAPQPWPLPPPTPPASLQAEPTLQNLIQEIAAEKKKVQESKEKISVKLSKMKKESKNEQKEKKMHIRDSELNLTLEQITQDKLERQKSSAKITVRKSMKQIREEKLEKKRLEKLNPNVKKSASKLKKSDTKVKKSNSKLKKSGAKISKSDTEANKLDTKSNKADTKLSKSDTKANKPDEELKKSDTEAKKHDTASKKSDTKLNEPTTKADTNLQTSDAELNTSKTETNKLDRKSKKSVTIVRKSDPKANIQGTELNKPDTESKELDTKKEKSDTKLQTSDTELKKTGSENQSSDIKSKKYDTMVPKHAIEANKPDTEIKKPDAESKKSDTMLPKSDTEAGTTDRTIKESVTKLEKSDTKFKTSDSNSKKLLTKSKKSKTKLTRSVTKLKKSDTKLKKSDTKLNKSDTKLKKSDTKLKKSDNKLKKSDTKLKKSDTKLKKSDTKLKKSDTKLKKSGSKPKKSDTSVVSKKSNIKSVKPNKSEKTKSKKKKSKNPPKIWKRNKAKQVEPKSIGCTRDSELQRACQPSERPCIEYTEPPPFPLPASPMSRCKLIADGSRKETKETLPLSREIKECKETSDSLKPPKSEAAPETVPSTADQAIEPKVEETPEKANNPNCKPCKEAMDNKTMTENIKLESKSIEVFDPQAHKIISVTDTKKKKDLTLSDLTIDDAGKVIIRPHINQVKETAQLLSVKDVIDRGEMEFEKIMKLRETLRLPCTQSVPCSPDCKFQRDTTVNIFKAASVPCAYSSNKKEKSCSIKTSLFSINTYKSILTKKSSQFNQRLRSVFKLFKINTLNRRMRFTADLKPENDITCTNLLKEDTKLLVRKIMDINVEEVGDVKMDARKYLKRNKSLMHPVVSATGTVNLQINTNNVTMADKGSQFNERDVEDFNDFQITSFAEKDIVNTSAFLVSSPGTTRLEAVSNCSLLKPRFSKSKSECTRNSKMGLLLKLIPNKKSKEKENVNKIKISLQKTCKSNENVEEEEWLAIKLEVCGRKIELK